MAFTLRHWQEISCPWAHCRNTGIRTGNPFVESPRPYPLKHDSPLSWWSDDDDDDEEEHDRDDYNDDNDDDYDNFEICIFLLYLFEYGKLQK